MKTLCAAFVGMLLASTSHGQATAFPIKLTSGLIKQDQSERTVSISFNTKWLVGPVNSLILVVDVDNRQLRLLNVDPQTNIVATLAESSRCAILTNGVFNGILEFSDLTVSNGLFSTTGDGAILIHGELQRSSSGKVKLSGKLDGVLNDPVNGNPDEPDQTIKATIQPAGKGFDAEELGF